MSCSWVFDSLAPQTQVLSISNLYISIFCLISLLTKAIILQSRCLGVFQNVELSCWTVVCGGQLFINQEFVDSAITSCRAHEPEPSSEVHHLGAVIDVVVPNLRPEFHPPQTPDQRVQVTRNIVTDQRFWSAILTTHLTIWARHFSMAESTNSKLIMT